MAVRRLTNETWGFESNCFVCEPRNDAGLRIPFHHDDEADVVRAEFTLDDRFSGAPTYVHGGLTLAVLDEAMAWATIAVGGKFATTTETTTRFLHPVRVGRAYAAEARLEGADDGRMTTSGVVRDARDRVCAEAHATFTVLSAARAVDALGTEPTEGEAGYLG